MSITINPINDPPEIIFIDDLSVYSNSNMFFDDTLIINVEISDVDNSLSELTFIGNLPNDSINAELDIIQTIENDTVIENQRIIFDLNDVSMAGLFKMSLCASDLEATICDGEIEAYYIHRYNMNFKKL